MNLFIFCILSRLLLSFIAKSTSSENLKYIGIFTLIISLGFFIIYLTNGRKTGIEVGGKKIWWNNERPIHGSFYLIFSISAFYGKNLWYLLLIDTILGLFNYLYHYY